jgi:predicted transcriptional regulator
MSTKDQLLDMIRKMPDDLTIEDVMQELYVRQKIEAGLLQIDQGETVSHDEVKASLARWLK